MLLLAGAQVVNHHLMKDLTELGLWNEAMKHKLIAHGGSVQSIDEIPAHIKKLYKTVWEISQKVLINMAADRGAYIDQSQSLNMYIAEPNFGKLTSMHFYAWNKVCVCVRACVRVCACASCGHCVTVLHFRRV